jgi:acyl-CoA thioester hydrolase
MPNAFSHRLPVRFRDCDAMGHVNNAVYLTYLEEARFAYWRAVWGAEMGAPGTPGVILARVEIDYKRPATFGETLDVRIRLENIGRSSITSSYEIVNASGDLIAAATSVLVVYDYAAGRSVPVTEEVRARLLAF